MSRIDSPIGEAALSRSPVDVRSPQPWKTPRGGPLAIKRRANCHGDLFWPIARANLGLPCLKNLTAGLLVGPGRRVFRYRLAPAFYHEPTRRDIAGVATPTGQRTGTPAGGQHRAQALWSGEWLVEKHAARTRRSWRKLHIGVDADTGQIVAAELTSNDVDDGSQVGPLLEQIAGPVASFTGDGAYDRDDVYREVGQRHPDAAVIVPPRSSAVPSATAETTPTQRDRHLQQIADRGRMVWQRASGYNWRALVEADIGRYKRVIGDALRSRTNGRQMTEVAIAVASLNRMLDLGRPEYVRLT